ncbi:bifunctional ornithine acetyltransferase/N-acetylglutamate synthase [Paenarthrobacter sp. Z7-10]|uniref:bifunctional glutamate N-acetyltransferase/amino-acid acetyltransferase n=1 Tax=Paenarthrobacter sp. Z7-10 TaxID=2787635 RepID=UPI0022A93BE2|nr:bifunctional ornithine acetyltransferase/N-acetylglutamate synthase [Paenarthrobacter sp. Z7-10]MCZ2404332.1 bifunctional ornithine acetyltransferase/N-acetylglutamate synthase [Paenarthrobacter sp. Z7-10]
MSVTSPRGFRASGVTAGLKASGAPDLALVVNDGPQKSAAAVFTSNRVAAAPVLWSREVLRDGRVDAVVLNSGGANACTGPQGFQNTHLTAEKAAGFLGVSATDVVVCSTGLIGEQLPMDKLLAGVEAAVAALGGNGADPADDDDGGRGASDGRNVGGGKGRPTSGGAAAATAIRTTDTRSKEALWTALVPVAGHAAASTAGFDAGSATGSGTGPDGGSATGVDALSVGGYSIGGMAKGAGMLAPGLATMLVVLTTDAVVESEGLDTALRDATRMSFDRVDSDGCMSTNDTVLLLASGASGTYPDMAEFTAGLSAVCQDLAQQLIGDAEGASHNISISTVNAASEQDAVLVGKTVARSNLFKAAIFGNDPNWGRVLAAVGTTDAVFDPDQLDVSINGVKICRNGGIGDSRDLVDLTPREVSVEIDLHAGAARATILTNDLTHAYVEENSAYSS